MPLRPATLDDYPALCRLWTAVDELHARVRPDYFRRAAPPPRARAEVQRALAEQTQLHLVAEEGGQVVGLVEARLYDTPRQPQMVPHRRVYVDELVVDEGQRGRGIGRALMDAASAWARERGAEQLVLTVWAGNDAAAAFYRELGFEPVSQVLGRALD